MTIQLKTITSSERECFSSKIVLATGGREEEKSFSHMTWNFWLMSVFLEVLNTSI